jgi:phage shock protein A
MRHQIPMAAELGKCAAGLNARLRSTWDSRPGPSEARWLLGKIGFWVAAPGLDAAYQRHLVALRRVRRAVADVATSRKRLELQIRELERQAGRLGDPGHEAMSVSQIGTASHGQPPRSITEQLAGLRRQYASMQAKEERAAAASRELMAKTEAFRTGKEAIKAAYSAAERAAGAALAETAPGIYRHGGTSGNDRR